MQDTRAQRSPTILLLAGDTSGNLGDQAILLSVCQEIWAHLPSAHIATVSHRNILHSPLCQTIKPGLPGIFALCRAAYNSNVVIIGGGGLFQDDDSLVKMPYWAFRTILMRLFCSNVVGLSLGIGPLAALSSRTAAKFAFAAMKRISARDELGQTLARRMTTREVELVPDPALLLDSAGVEEVNSYLRAHGLCIGSRPLLGVALRRWVPLRRRVIPNKLKARFFKTNMRLDPQGEHFITLVAEVLDRVVASCDAEVVFLPSYNVSHEADDVVADKVANRMSAKRAAILRIEDPRLYKGVTARLDAMLGGRMHPAILAVETGTPIIGLAYNPKFVGFFSLLGLEAQVVDCVEFVKRQEITALATMLSAALRAGRHRLPVVDRLQAVTRQYLADIIEAPVCYRCSP